MTATAAATPPTGARAAGLLGTARLAFRELRGGIRGLWILIACVALGVAVIAGVGALADALRAGFERQGQVLLGGDVTLARPHRRADAPERAWMAAQGRVSESATLRAMARRLDGADQALVELKGVDAAYPLTGTLRLAKSLSASTTPASALADDGAVVEEILLEQLQAKLGDRIRMGNREVEIRAVLASEPDKISDRMTFGPRVLVSIATLVATGLVEPGSLVRWRYALELPSPADTAALAAFRAAAKTALPDAGFTAADRRDPAPQVTRTLDRLRQFLSLIGLTSLLVGGVGIANAIAAYVERRRKVIATLKSIGASNRQIFVLHLMQVLAITAVGIVLGLGLGMLLPPAAAHLLGDVLPVPPEFTARPLSLLLAVAYGTLVSLLFVLWPLGRAGSVRAAVLFRDEVAPEPARPPAGIVAATVAIGIALLLLALATSESQRIALYFCLSVAGLLLAFWGLGSGLTWLARRVPRPRSPALALALGNLGAPGGLTRSVVLSLGTGLSLLVAVSLVDASIVAELETRLPKNSPSFFVLDIPRPAMGDLDALIRRLQPAAHVNQAPMLRGRIVRLGDRPVDQIRVAAEAQWVLNGDRGLTYAEQVPEGSAVVAGSWWPAGYDGEPLVSFEAELAKLLGLKLGDQVTVNVLGRNITARVSNLREVRWESLGINFVMVFSPNALKGAPVNLLATIALPASVPIAEEAALAREIGRNFPAVTAIRVKDAINAFEAVFSRIMVAVRAADAITLLAGALVLAGAVAAAQRRRIKQAVILKAIGATSGRILAAHAVEYLILAAATTGIAVLLGMVAAWVTLHQIMRVDFVFSGKAVLSASAVAATLMLGFGGVSTWRALRARPVPYLRAE